VVGRVCECVFWAQGHYGGYLGSAIQGE
jgi:hypothetical protein